ncbi:NUDIX hydrolase [Candidatus Woesearchaeota archaeon]|nr:NUDIX hydrolase [Candidatus Woesearchaeota archaeon]
MNKERAKILTKLIHKPNMGFNELWNKEGESNKFAYHLKMLDEAGYIEKKGEKYSLTHKGKMYAAYASGESGSKEEAPLLGVIAVIFNGKGQTLMVKRKKEPFYGYWGMVGGKMKFTQYILEAAKAEIKEETGLDCDVELKGIFSSKTYNNNELSYNHQMFVVKGTNPRGALTPSREGEPCWIDLDKIESLRSFPNVAQSINIALGNGFSWVEADRRQENDEFKDMKILKEIKF